VRVRHRAILEWARFYRKVCGGELSEVLDTLAYLAVDTSVWLDVKTIPTTAVGHLMLRSSDHLGADYACAERAPRANRSCRNGAPSLVIMADPFREGGVG
jgi:hypothetical protein